MSNQKEAVINRNFEEIDSQSIAFDLSTYELEPEFAKKAEDMIEDLMQKLQTIDLWNLKEEEVDRIIDPLIIK